MCNVRLERVVVGLAVGTFAWTGLAAGQPAPPVPAMKGMPGMPGMGMLAGSGGRAPAFGSPDDGTLRGANLGSDGPALLQFLGKRARSGADPAQTSALVRGLADKSARVQGQSIAELVSVGEP